MAYEDDLMDEIDELREAERDPCEEADAAEFVTCVRCTHRNDISEMFVFADRAVCVDCAQDEISERESVRADLLAACQDLLLVVNAMAELAVGGIIPEEQAAIERAEAAIEKATGGPK